MSKHAGYMPQLDSLRAFAVLLVIVSHWFSRDHILNRFTPNGILGVTLFFVLSGYLITGILLRNKIAIEKGGSLKDAFKTFYIRRSLRIFPIYYLLIFILLVIGFSDIRQSFLYHFFYASNFYFWLKGAFTGSLSHFWSLAVEEQFYLFWPSVILFVPRAKLLQTFFAGIIIAVLFRLWLIDPPNNMGRLLMPASLDSFCLGAIFALGQQQQAKWYKWVEKHLAILLVAGLGCYILYELIQKHASAKAGNYLFLGFYFTLISIIFAFIIIACSRGVKNPIIAFFLNNKMFIYLGKISYGLYLYHNLVPYLYNVNLPYFLSPFSLYVVQMIRLIILIGVATISWYLVERPLLKLKDRFIFRSPPSSIEPIGITSQNFSVIK